MTHALIPALFVATLFVSASAHAQVAPSAFGHWEGAINSPLGSQPVEIDLGPGLDGQAIAAISVPAENIRGLPLGNVSIEGQQVRFELPGANAGVFSGAVAEDGRTLSGVLDQRFGSADFSLTRVGAARFAGEPASAAIDARFAGEWAGAMEMHGRQVPLRLALSNLPDRGGVGRLFVDNAVAIPLGVKHDGDRLALDVVSTGESVSLLLTPDVTLSGEYRATTGETFPLSLRRAASKE